MRRAIAVLLSVLVFSASAAYAELVDVKVGGSLRIRTNWYSEIDRDFDNGDSPDAFYVEQRTRINVDAEFTEFTRAFVELDSYNNWGDDFAGFADPADDGDSDEMNRGVALGSGTVLTGIDDSARDEVSLYQGYVEFQNILGWEVFVRIGRQEIDLGSEFLVGNNDTSSSFRGLSFDGLTLQTEFGDFIWRSFYTILAANNNPDRLESSGGIWFHGNQFSYIGFEGMELAVFGVRYFQALTDPVETLGYDEHIELYTFGARFAGERGRFDWIIEGAYQMGDSGLPDPYDSVSAFAATGALGYTFDVRMQPRIFINGAYYSGDEEDASFNRLFSDYEYSEFLDSTDMSNVWLVGGGVGAQVTESIGLSLTANYYNTVEDYDNDDSDIGIEVGLYADYAYSDELSFSAGYAHLFAGDALEDGVWISASGAKPVQAGPIGGLGDSDDLDYIFLETSISF